MNSTSATATPGPQRHRDAVAGRHRRVGGDREALAGAAGGERRVAGADLDAAAPSASSATHAGGTGRPRRAGRGRASARGPRRVVDAHRGDQGPLDLGAGGVAAGVDDPGDGVAALRVRASGRGLAVAGAVEHRAERDELADPVGALGHEDPHRVGVAQAGAGGERVGEVELGRVVAGVSSAAATPPWAYRVAELASSPLVRTTTDQPAPCGVDRGREAGDAAAEHEEVDRRSGIRRQSYRCRRNPLRGRVRAARGRGPGTPRRSAGCARRRARPSARTSRARPRRTARR